MPGRVRVVQVSTDDVTGGAARCAYRLHRGLRKAGHRSEMFVHRKRSEDDSVHEFQAARSLTRRLARRWRRWKIHRDHARYEESAPSWREPFHGDRTEYAGEVVDALPPADVVHLHWVSRFVDLRAFFEGLPAGTPVVWTLHDMHLVTGGCHYDRGCGRFRDRCGACPQLGSDEAGDLSRAVWERKDRLLGSLEEGRLHLVTPSRWLAEVVSRSSLAGGRFPVSVIPYGVDTQVFAPRDPGFSREMLGVPRDARVVLFVAHSVENDRKGFRTLRGALDGLRGQDDLFLLSLGKGAPSVPDDVAHRHLGFVTEDRYLSAVYSAADVFVVPSHQDNLPATVLESLACGTPVVGSQVGGIPEMVRPGETGALVPEGEPDALAEGIRGLLREDVGVNRMRDRCREVAVEEYPLDLQARRYADLYRDLLHATGREGGREGSRSITAQGTATDGVRVAPGTVDTGADS